MGNKYYSISLTVVVEKDENTGEMLYGLWKVYDNSSNVFKDKDTKDVLKDVLKELDSKYGSRYQKDKKLAAEYIYSLMTKTIEGYGFNPFEAEMQTSYTFGKEPFYTVADYIKVFEYLDERIKDDESFEYTSLSAYVTLKKKEEDFRHTYPFEIYPSTQLDNFIKDKAEFLVAYQVGSDEFAYDFEDKITEDAKSIFGEDKVKMAIYDFGGDYVDFKILMELFTDDEEENKQYFYFINQSDNNLPKGITAQDCLKMQKYSYDLVKELYNNYMSF